MLSMLKLAKRALLESDKRLLWKLAWNMGLKGAMSVRTCRRYFVSEWSFPMTWKLQPRASLHTEC